MANNYGPNQTPGQIRRRVFYFHGFNPNALSAEGGTPSIVFHEEEVMLGVDGKERQVAKVGEVKLTFNPGLTFPMRAPQTDAVIPGQTASQAQVLQMLYSLARWAQEQRDAQG